MRRYWIPSERFLADPIVIKEDDFHHIVDVCRQGLGSKFELLGDGRKAHLVELTQLSKKMATVQILETRELPAPRQPNINICLSFPRYPVLDAVIEKSVEMGVHRILPFYSEYSFIRDPKSLSAGKSERWQKIIQSATQQSGRGDLMTIEDPCTWNELFKKVNPSTQSLCLFAYEGQSTLGIKSYLESLPMDDRSLIKDVFIFIGSEGGFSTTEVEKFQDLGLKPITLGDQVLRVETACITLVAILKYYFGQLDQTREGAGNGQNKHFRE